eukprot:CAMPEP_0114344388 /NCGR_PEP_ID=MMETSP0101-20121206/11380_1 /TAXON_ID=38822 ORGANISM="Pteridomonas danica, Strain PT" /NCGR_SAMPLE_ID=MMETSP0101 /ASSEMBLY_ACC=CAM_ASM_000211 /LENGTH=377 /DNA_ID=CAMNT_0001479707 /DNA_START=17 /DNA_END=1150 /DNA_ORIENTATION=-
MAVAAHSWEGKMDMSWQGLSEDDDGNLRDTNEKVSQVQRAAVGAVQRGMIRYLYLIIDMSKSMQMTDFHPNRANVTKKLISQFIVDFLAENPISQLGLIVMRHGRAENLADLSGSKSALLKALDSLTTTGGDASLQNALDMTCSLMRDVPEYGHREVVLLFSSLSTKDPGDITSTIDNVRRLKIHVSVIGMLAEVHILKVISTETEGLFVISTCVEHLRRCFAGLLQPPSTSLEQGSIVKSEMVEMGFPTREQILPSSVPFIGYDGGRMINIEQAYKCPRCQTHMAEVPSMCSICGLTLITAPHLAHSYHHLFPLNAFSPNTVPSLAPRRCYGCNTEPEQNQETFRCADCSNGFCGQCEMFLHETLHNCPGCLSMNG